MASITTIILFFVYLWGLGFTATYYLKKPENGVERFILNLGIGLGVFPILSVLLNLFHIPLDWKIFLFLSTAFPLFTLFKAITKKNVQKPSLRITKSTIYITLAIFIAAASFYVYTQGAFAYPYLENEDPWGHAVGVKYVAREKNAYDPIVTSYDDREIDIVLSYIDPYPPAYDIFMAILHQTSPDLKWTLKFFNSLIISLGFAFFYLFAFRFMNNRKKALFATFILASVPSYLSHFIWAHGMVITLFFPALIAFNTIKEDKRWTYLAGIIVASIWVTQNVSQPLKISTLIFMFLVITSITYKKIQTHGFAALFGGFALSFTWWGVMIKKYTLKTFLGYYGVTGTVASTTSASHTAASSSISAYFSKLIAAFTSSGGTGSRAYTFGDFFYAQHQNMINNPIGVGAIVSLLTLFGIAYVLIKYREHIVTEKNTWRAVALFWLLYLFWGVNGETFHIPVARGAFRVWMLMSIPLALIAAEGTFSLIKIIPRRIPFQKAIILILIITGVIFTSAHQKYSANTAIWPTSGAFAQQSTPFLYGQWFDTLPPNTKVFLYSPRDKLTIGYGAWSCYWCDDIRAFRQEILERDSTELHTFLKENNYEYLVINGPMDFKHFEDKYNNTEELLTQRYNEFTASSSFTVVHTQEQSFAVLRVN
jgi:hypothetical protein